MKSVSLLFALALGVFSVTGLTSCDSGGPVDLRYPTVRQMDDMDVTWGLPRRKPRGTPTRQFEYDASQSQPRAAATPEMMIAPELPDPPLEVRPAEPPPPAAIPPQLR